MAAKGGDTSAALGLLVLRLGAGGMLAYAHGWSKLTHFTTLSRHFSDPLHIGSPASLALTVFAEVVCAVCVAVGFATRFVVVPLLILFGVIIFVVSGSKPFEDRELAIFFGLAFAAIALLGPGRFSIDGARGRV